MENREEKNIIKENILRDHEMERYLPHYILLFDEDCPMCAIYARLFAWIGLMPIESFIPWAKGIEVPGLVFDFELSKDKIALINTQTQKTIYGLDSIIEILSFIYPWLKKILQFTPLYFFLSKLYTFIAHNRKIIAAIDCGDRCPCNPSKHYLARVLFILLCGVFVHWQVTHYFTTILSDYYIGNKLYGDFLFFLGQLGFQFLVFKLMNQRNFYNYAGHVSFVSFLGAVLLGLAYLGLDLLKQWGLEIGLLGSVIYGMVFCFMYYEHKRRIALEGWSPWLSLTWVLYRLLIYPFAFRLFI